MSSVFELLQRLNYFVELIASAIESNDWDGLNVILANRQEALNRLGALTLSEQERELVVKMMTSIQSTDRQFLALVQNQKKALQKQAASLAHDRKAIQAYQSE